MSKRFTIGLLVFFAGVAGNLVAGWLQQGKWAIQPTTEQFLGTLLGAGLILFVVALLESEHALAWNWRWHRFWYLRELLKNPDLRHWETDFARLEMVQGRQKIFGAEVIAEGKRQDMVEVLRELIIGRQEKVPRVLVLGQPGSGKTTGLERLTLDLAHAGSRRLGIGCMMPVLLRLGNFQRGPLLDFAAQKMEQATKQSSGEILSKGIKKLIKQGRVVLLCDALDEALGKRRDEVLAELGSFFESRTYQNVPIVITSRTREDPGGRLKGLIVFEIQDLSDEAVNAFIRAYKQPEHYEAEITQQLHKHRLLGPGGLKGKPFWLRLIFMIQDLSDEAVNAIIRAYEQPQYYKTQITQLWLRLIFKIQGLSDEPVKTFIRAYKQPVHYEAEITQQLHEHRLLEPGGLKGKPFWLRLIFKIQGLSDEAVNAIIRAYTQPEHKEAEITKQLHEHQLLELGGLGRNPFWLRLIVASDVFAGNKAQILNKVVDILLAREWEEKPAVERAWRRVLPSHEQIEETKRALAFLGYWMSTGNLVAIEEDGVLIALEKGWLTKREQAGVKGLRPQDILGLGRDAQILIYDPGPIRFRHRLLQEFMTAWMLMVDEGLREKEIEHCAEDTGWWETLFLLGRLLGSICSSQAYSQLVQRVFGNGTNDQRLFAAIGLLRCVENPPAELANSLLDVFKTSMSEGLTETQFSTARELGRILGDDAAEAFGVLFRSPQHLAKTQGAKLLCGLRSKRANEILVTALEEGEITIEFLSSIGEEAVDLLSTVLRDPNWYMRWRVVTALRTIGGLRAIEPLITALHDSDSVVRWRAADALGEIGGARAVESLITALHDLSEHVRSNVAFALGTIRDPHAVEPLIAALCDSNSYLLSQAAEALGKIGDPRAVESLITTLRNPDKIVRIFAADALGKIGASAIAPLSIALRDSDSNVRRGASEALGNIGDPRAVETLITALKDSDKGMRFNAAEALVKIGKPAVEPLIAALKDSHDDVRRRTAETLGKIGDPRALPELERVASEDKSETWWGADVAEAARQAAEKIRQRMAEDQKRTA